jgi:glycine/D-amino acid oxidase-like deaminating enzyme
MLAAYGYGGNGITFSFLASRLLASLVGGVEAPWFQHFAIDRRDPTKP